MKKISEIIDMAALNLGIKQAGEALEASEADVLLQVLKFSLSELSIKFWGCKNYEKDILGKNPIILGTNFSGVSADIAERPAKIEDIRIKFGDTYKSIDIKSYHDYLSLSYLKPSTSFPNCSFIKYDNDYISIYFYPQILENSEVKIFGKGYMTDENLTYSDYLEVPDEYIWHIVQKLTVNACRPFHQTPTQDMLTALATSEKNIKANKLLSEMETMGSDFQTNYGRKSFNSYTGGFY